MLKENGTIVTDATEIAEMFNAFYSSTASDDGFGIGLLIWLTS